VGGKSKEEEERKDNAEAQRPLRFAEEEEEADPKRARCIVPLRDPSRGFQEAD
jgi:hypothetical protein